jgi:hypothetical protein
MRESRFDAEMAGRLRQYDVVMSLTLSKQGSPGFAVREAAETPSHAWVG